MCTLDLGMYTLKLDEVISEVSFQLDGQASLGVQITRVNEVPDSGPTNKGLWLQIPNVTAIFADIKGSTELNTSERPRDAAFAYTYFVRAMTVTLERFEAKYIDIHGDGIFGLFSGQNSTFMAAACAITMKTQVERHIAERFKQDTLADWELTAGIGIDRGTLLVRRLGLRGTKQNEVWAGKPVNVAAKLSSVADSNQLVVPDRVFGLYQKASQIRRRALIWSCGCDYDVEGDGLDSPEGETANLWDQEIAPGNMGLDFDYFHRLKSQWCKTHGAEFCEAIISGRRPEG